ncbi:MAG TPA: HD domain-containing phosphohydrolase [Anaerolineaceae bacterium]|nr:HD domain-containing phosphohydrolase [Anaerolineaceae bacterium]
MRENIETGTAEAHNFGFESDQRKRTLNFILWIAFFASVLLGLISIHFEDYQAGYVILLLNPTCLVCLFLNARGKFYTAAGIASVVMFFAAVYDLYSRGSLLDDMGIVAFPVLIVACSLLFGKRGLYVFSGLSLLAISAIGVLEINRLIINQPSKIDASDLTTALVLVLCVSVLVWVIIDNAQKNLQRIKADDQDIRVSYELTLESLAKALEFRDRDTESHSRRVVELSLALAKEMGLGEEDLVNIRRGALLHDIGKLAIPDKILLKPGALSHEERSVMQEHAAHAMELLSDIPFLQPCISIPYCHHERWDGTGYPQGLKGEEIPLYARIFTIIDQWEALNSDRPYRNAWPRETILNYIKDNSGKIYDPKVVEKFLSLIGGQQEEAAGSASDSSHLLMVKQTTEPIIK